jgi:uncharacterized protein
MATQSRAAVRHSPGSPLIYDITRLPRRPGFMHEIRETVASPTRIGLELIAIPEGAPLELDLRFESVSEGVLVTGSMRAPTAGECSRCLGAVSGEVDIHITELFAYPDSTTAATTEEDEVGHIVDEQIDLEQPIIDAVGLELPLSPLCREDCPGLCPECGVKLAEAEPGHRHDAIDPRWAKLTGMFTDHTPKRP